MIEFKLNEKETKAAEKFITKHRHSDVYKGAIGGHIEYRIIPTSLGDTINIYCHVCNMEENITDYGCW